MSDSVSSGRELKIEAMFVDGDTRTFNIKEPKSNVDQADIANLNTYMQENNILVGDKYGGRFGKITIATTVDKTTTTLDLETI